MFSSLTNDPYWWISIERQKKNLKILFKFLIWSKKWKLVRIKIYNILGFFFWKKKFNSPLEIKIIQACTVHPSFWGLTRSLIVQWTNSKTQMFTFERIIVQSGSTISDEKRIENCSIHYFFFLYIIFSPSIY